MGLMDTLTRLLGKKNQTSTGAASGSSGLGGLGNLGSLLSGLGGSGGGVLKALLPMLTGGGLAGILNGLQGGPHVSKLSSWVGTGPNAPIAPDDVEAVLGKDQVAKIAAESGVSRDEAKSSLSKLLPGVIDHLSPGGSLPDSAGVDAALAKLKSAAG